MIYTKIINALSLILSLCFIVSITASAQEMNYPVYKSKSNEEKKIALTFDDGPHPKKTQEIIKVLEKYGVKATFFVVGVNVKNYPRAMQALVDSGYEIGNHTYSHKLLKNADKARIKDEIEKTEIEIIKNGSEKTKLIRPPCGEYNENLIDISLENDYKIVLWNIDTRDWAHTKKNDIAKNVLSKIKGGDIILFHDYISGKNDTVEALELIIPSLLEQGYEFVSVSELLQ